MLIFFVNPSISGLEERTKVRIIDKIIAILKNQIITNTHRKNVIIAAISVVKPSCFSLNTQ
jgi:hypothetical protein